MLLLISPDFVKLKSIGFPLTNISIVRAGLAAGVTQEKFCPSPDVRVDGTLKLGRFLGHPDDKHNYVKY